MSAIFTDALLGFPITNVLSVASVGGATGGTTIGFPTGSVVEMILTFWQAVKLAVSAIRKK
jgi:hypothetical protein